MEEAIISAGVLFVLLLVLIAIKYLRIKRNINLIELEKVVESEVIEQAQETIDKTIEVVEKKKRGRKKKNQVLPIILLMFFLTSCVTPDKELIKDGIDIIKWLTTDKDSASVKMPIDSIVIKFNPVYYKVNNTNYVTEIERDTILAGYEVWELETKEWRRSEIKKLDTIIYLYKR